MMIAWYRWPISLAKLICSCIQTTYLRCRLTFLSLTYNHFVDASYVADVCMGPMFWFVDNFTNTIGSLLVFAVSSLTTSVVLIAYWIGIPHWWTKSPLACVVLVIIGHWILLNISFNYYMACTVLPGYPPEGELITEAVSICKKCIAPKPPRTHHCSVCNRCILKMDHHCPWLNNCVGHRNHRYFYFYMIYMVVGVFFVILSGWEIAYAVIFLGKDSDDEDPELEGHSVKINRTGAFIPVTGTVMLDPVFFENHELETPNQLRRRCIIYMTLLNLGVFLALGCLAAWHGILITRNETSVETHINKAETLRMKDMGKVYVNPYDLGPKRNWKFYLNWSDKKNGWLQLFFPSIYEPVGDGLSWPTIHDMDLLDKICNINKIDIQGGNTIDSDPRYTFQKCSPRCTSEGVQNRNHNSLVGFVYPSEHIL